MPLDSTGYLSPTSYGERDILFHRPTVTEQEQANSEQSVRARRAVDEDGEALRRAADIIEQRGWCRGGAKTDGRVCLWYALGYATNDDAWGHGQFKWTQKLGFMSMPDAWSWNDAPGRTAAEVIARLRSAAEQGA